MSNTPYQQNFSPYPPQQQAPAQQAAPAEQKPGILTRVAEAAGAWFLGNMAEKWAEKSGNKGLAAAINGAQGELMREAITGDSFSITKLAGGAAAGWGSYEATGSLGILNDVAGAAGGWAAGRFLGGNNSPLGNLLGGGQNTSRAFPGMPAGADVAPMPQMSQGLNN